MKRTFTLVLTGCTMSNPPSSTSRATSAPTGGAAARAADTWAPGSSWVYRYESPRGSGTFEWAVDREEQLDEAPQQQAQNVLRKCAADGPEKITVPAGTFDTTKTMCEDVNTSEIVDDAWYAGAAKQLARERLRFSTGDGWRERELIGIRLFTDH